MFNPKHTIESVTRRLIDGEGTSMAGLFDAADDARRERLFALGWFQVQGWHWRTPSGEVVSEAEAFERLLKEGEQCQKSN